MLEIFVPAAAFVGFTVIVMNTSKKLSTMPSVQVTVPFWPTLGVVQLKVPWVNVPVLLKRSVMRACYRRECPGIGIGNDEAHEQATWN